MPAVSGTVFQSTLPGWGATRVGVTADAIQVEFQSTLPGWGATSSPLGVATTIARFQSTLPGWGATAKMDIFAHDMGKIIHFQH